MKSEANSLFRSEPIGSQMPATWTVASLPCSLLRSSLLSASAQGGAADIQYPLGSETNLMGPACAQMRATWPVTSLACGLLHPSAPVSLCSRQHSPETAEAVLDAWQS